MTFWDETVCVAGLLIWLNSFLLLVGTRSGEMFERIDVPIILQVLGFTRMHLVDLFLSIWIRSIVSYFLSSYDILLKEH